MKSKKSFSAALLAATLLTSSALAQTLAPPWSDPAPAANTSSNQLIVLAADAQGASPSDRPVAPLPPGIETTRMNAVMEEAEEEPDDEDKPFQLFKLPALEKRRIDIRGWVDAGYTWNPDYPANRFNGPVTFNDRANEFQMNQLYFIGERVTETDECNPWDIGGRIDFMYGTDSRFLTTYGLDDDWSDDHRFYGLALPQLYGDVAYDKWLFRVGHFYTIVGYEVCTAPDNFFYSHAYAMQYGEPFTHTGALAKYTLNDQWSFTGGIHRGWDQWEDINNELGFLGGFTWNLPNEKTSLTSGLVVSDEAPEGTADSTRTLLTTVLIHKFNDRLRYVFQNDLGYQNDSPANNGEDAEWYSLVNYLFYDLNPRWGLGARYELFTDDDGVRVAGLGDSRGRGQMNGIPLSAVPSHWQEVSLGVNFKPNPNVVVRSELRWDWVDPMIPVTDGPFDDFSDRSQFLLGTDVIVRF